METSKTIFDAEKTITIPKVIKTDTNGETQSVSAVNVSAPLMKLKGIWPFDMAPDEMIIEEKRLIIKINYFPIGNTVITIPIERVSLFQITTDLFFSAIKIVDSQSTANNILVKWLKPKEATRAKALIEGLQLKTKNNIVVPQVKKETYVRTVQEIGRV